MQYKFEFLLSNNGVPYEYLQRHLENKKRQGLEEIAKMIGSHYPYAVKTNERGEDLFSIELVCCSSKKYNEAMRRIELTLSLHPNLAEIKHIIKTILEEMQYPENELS